MITEVALSLVLLVGAGLLTRTFVNLMGVGLGFDPHNVLTCQIELNGERYDTTTEASSFYSNALEKIQGLAGVEGAAVVNKLPLDWQFNMGMLARQKYIDPTSVVPGEAIGDLKPWHGEWMAEIVHTIAPEAMIIPINSKSIKGGSYQKYLIQGLYYAADHGATARGAPADARG